jgi:dephospho-CoA kinase
VSNFSTDSSARSSIVGLTGGIGSGKSTVAHIFSMLSIHVWDADLAGRRLYSEHEELQEWVVQTFGEQCGVWVNGKLKGIDRSKLAEVVFHDSAALQALNAQVHPLVRSAFKQWHERVDRLHNAPYVIRESAILFESGAHEDCAHVIAVSANEPLRIERVKQRDDTNADEIRSRMRAQLSDIERIKRSDSEIQNNTTSLLLKQVLENHLALSAVLS